MDKILRVGFVGLTHDHVWSELPHWKALPNISVAGVTENNSSLVDRFHTFFPGVPVFKDPISLFNSATIDAIQVMSSNLRSVEIGADALERGIHVLLEKPMASNLEGADKLLRAKSGSRAKLMINWPSWWRPNMKAAEEILKSGELGDIFYARMRMAHRGPQELGCSPEFCEWLYSETENGGGAYMDYCCYGAASFCYLFGKPERVEGWRGRLLKKNLPVDDNGLLTLYYKDKVCVAEGSWTQGPSHQGASFYGTSGVMELDKEHLWVTGAEGVRTQREFPPHHNNGPKHFVESILCNKEIEGIFSAELGREAQRVLELGKGRINIG